MLKLDRGIMNTFQLQSVNIYAKQANYRGGHYVPPPHQYTGEKSPSGIGLSKFNELLDQPIHIGCCRLYSAGAVNAILWATKNFLLMYFCVFLLYYYSTPLYLS